MIKKILSMIIIILMCLTVVVAQDRIELNSDLAESGSKDFYEIDNELGFWSKLKLSLFSKRYGDQMTVVDGATCSRNPDEEWDRTYDCSGELEVTYNNQYYQGVVFQVFKKHPWTYIGEKEISQGEVKGFDLECNGGYRFLVYYCDETAERTCSDSDGDDKYTKGEVTFQIGDEPEETYTDKCSTPDEMVERVCDIDDSVRSKTYDCECDNGACVQEEDEEEEQCETTAIGSEECSGGNVVQTFQYSDCSQKDIVVDECDDDEKCENARCVSTVQTITCYQCQEGKLTSKKFENSCDSGWQAQVPSCETEDDEDNKTDINESEDGEDNDDEQPPPSPGENVFQKIWDDIKSFFSNIFSS